MIRPTIHLSEQNQPAEQQTTVRESSQTVDSVLRGSIDLGDTFEPESTPPVPAAAEKILPEAALASVMRPKKRWGLRLAGLALAGVVAIESSQFLLQQVVEQSVLAACYALLLTSVIGIAGRTLWRESRLLRRLRRQAELQQQATQIGGELNNSQAAQLTERIMSQLGDKLPVEGREQFLSRLSDTHSSQEVLSLFSHTVLSPMDKQALARIRRWSSEAAVMVALSPLAALDMALILWRNQKLVDDIAGIYGIELGYWSRIKLLRLIVLNVIYAGSSEVIADMGFSALGADLTGRVSGRMAQGMGAGLLTARLGLQCVHLCRPVAFLPQEKPRMSDLTKGMQAQISQLLQQKA